MAGDISRINGRKGGRKKGPATLEAERMRNMIAEKLASEFAPILSKAVEQAKAGNQQAREWLTDRAFGRTKEIKELTVKNPTPLIDALSNNNSNKETPPTPEKN